MGGSVLPTGPFHQSPAQVDRSAAAPGAGRSQGRASGPSLGLVGIVLGAGAGRRMGGPKVLLSDRHGATLGQRHAQRLLECGCELVLLLVPPRHGPLILRRDSLSPDQLDSIRVVEAETQSPAETLACALRQLASFGACFITPVDLAPVEPSTAARLRAGLCGSTRAVTPSYRGRGGHPVLLAASAVHRPVPGEPAKPLREALRALGSARRRVEVDDAAVLSDWDQPAELGNRFRLPASIHGRLPAR